MFSSDRGEWQSGAAMHTVCSLDPAAADNTDGPATPSVDDRMKIGSRVRIS